ncbi:hypothetical protein KUCAC02_017268, partial [Chaenocephalus aceratus]
TSPPQWQSLTQRPAIQKWKTSAKTQEVCQSCPKACCSEQQLTCACCPTARCEENHWSAAPQSGDSCREQTTLSLRPYLSASMSTSPTEEEKTLYVST